MKKVIIAAAIVLTSAVTALSVTKSDNKVAANTNVEKSTTAKASLGANTDNLATID